MRHGRIVAVALLAAAAGTALFLATRPEPEPDGPPAVAGFDEAGAAAVIEGYAGLLHAAYSEALGRAADLRKAVDAFVGRPTAEGLEACRAAWRAARPAYLQTEVARFYEGPVDGGGDAPETLLNAWPLDEIYIDYVEGRPDAGIINDPARFPRIEAEALRNANEKGGEANIATGWHAIEFLLWGQDLTPGPGGGKRSHLDYVDGGGTARNEARRREYLRVCAGLVEGHLSFLRDQWAPGNPQNYRAWFVAQTPRMALSKIMTGVGTLAFGELRGERLVVPYNTKDKEDEHSCFSDTTHLDHLNDALGIRNVWEGRLGAHSGTGLRELARACDPALAREVESRLDACVEALRDPALDPFETAIRGNDDAPGRAAIRRAMTRLSEFTASFFTLAKRMGVEISTSLR